MKPSTAPQSPIATPTRQSGARLRFWLGALISAAAVVVLSRRVVWDEFVASLSEVRVGFLALGLVGLAVGLTLKAKRWQILLRPVGRFAWMGDVLRYYVIGQMLNMVMPFKAGELLRPWLLARKHRLSMVSVLATVVVERLADVTALLGLYALALYLGLGRVRDEALRNAALAAAVLLGLTSLATLAMTRARARRAVQSLVARLPSRYAARIGGWTDGWLSGLRSVGEAGSLLEVSVVTSLIWLAGYVTLQCYLLGFGLHLAWYAPIVVVVVANLGTMVPSSPGGLGVAHLLYAYALSAFDVDMSTAVAFAVVAHGIGYLSIVASGLAASWYEGIALRDLGEVAKRGPDSSPEPIGG